MTKTSKTAQILEPGTRVYYTGDMANIPAVGTIVEIVRDARFGDDYRITWDQTDGNEGKPDSLIAPVQFRPGPGRRFSTLAEEQAKHEKAMASLRATMAQVRS